MVKNTATKTRERGHFAENLFARCLPERARPPGRRHRSESPSWTATPPSRSDDERRHRKELRVPARATSAARAAGRPWVKEEEPADATAALPRASAAPPALPSGGLASNGRGGIIVHQRQVLEEEEVPSPLPLRRIQLAGSANSLTTIAVLESAHQEAG